METKVLRKYAKWKKKMKPKKQEEKAGGKCEESFRSSCVSLPVNASTSTCNFIVYSESGIIKDLCLSTITKRV